MRFRHLLPLLSLVCPCFLALPSLAADAKPLPLILVKDIFPGIGPGTVRSLLNVGGTLYFTADDGANGKELWKSNGTPGGTVLVKDIVSGPVSAAFHSPLTKSDRLVFFGASNGANGSELWVSDGTAAGTRMVMDIWPGPGNAGPGELTDLNGRLIFAAGDPDFGNQLWSTDGTKAGTRRVNDVFGQNFDVPPTELTELNGTVFFAAGSSGSGAQLWRTDGTTAGTVLVKQINPKAAAIDNPGLPSLFATSFGLYFVARTPEAGLELWKSDGSETGTLLVADINPGTADSRPANVTEAGNHVFFTADDGVHGTELWVTDGTQGGTSMVLDINPGQGGSSPVQLTAMGGSLFFAADDGVHGYELWTSDGTAAGTHMVKDIHSGLASADPDHLTVMDGLVYFSAYNDASGHELWQSDGTEAGTVLVADIWPGSNGSYPNRLLAVDGALFFTANDGSHGYELWKLGTSRRIKPSITSISDNQLVPGGAPVLLTAAVAGTPAPACRWLKNGVPIPGANQSDLAIPAATLGDAGVYSIEVSNLAGSATASTKLAVVEDAGNWITGVNAHDTAAISAHAAGPGLTFQWHEEFGGATVLNGGRFSGANTARLSIGNVTAVDEGSSYFCTVKMGALQQDSHGYLVEDRSLHPFTLSGTGDVYLSVSGQIAGNVTDFVQSYAGQPDDGPVRYTAQGLPPGLLFDSTTGSITGTPLQTGSFTLKITGFNPAGGSASASVKIIVLPLPAPTYGTFTGLVDGMGMTITITVQANGVFTGSIDYQGVKTPLAGRLQISLAALDPSASLRLALREPGGALLPATLAFSISSASAKLSGTITEDIGYVHEVTARQNYWSAARPAKAYAARYTAAMQPPATQSGNTAVPEGNGWLSLTVAATGGVTITGRTACGTLFTRSTTLGPSGQVAVGCSELNNTEVIHGWLDITPGSDPTLNSLDNLGAFLWGKTAPYARVEPFVEQSLTVTGGAWIQPTGGAIVLDASPVPLGQFNAELSFSHAGIAGAQASDGGFFSQVTTLTPPAAVHMPAGPVNNPTSAALSVDATTGIFSGSFTLKDSNPLAPSQIITRTCAFSGVLVRRLSQGAGYFLLSQLPEFAGETSTSTPVLSGLAQFYIY